MQSQIKKKKNNIDKIFHYKKFITTKNIKKVNKIVIINKI